MRLLDQLRNLPALVPGITNRYCSPSFETATEPVIGRAFARPVGGLLRMRSNLLKHNNLMLRSERRERLEACAASDLPISHSQYYVDKLQCRLNRFLFTPAIISMKDNL